ncbi:MAG: protein-disulfide reductase DsbD family protein [Verrucomicrobia bacterium]|nr:protein-disulfide reductase DsbD family protein [Verrucomicrobiota bacterium]
MRPFFLRFWLLLFVALAPASWSRAQVDASLVALKATFPADAGKVVVGLRLAHQPKWHSYWIAPGTGLPTTLTWELPPGWSAGPILWPAPHRVYDTSGHLAGNGYEGVVYLPVELKPPAGLAAGVPVTLRAKAEWLMCKDVCKPGEAAVALTLTPTPAGAMTAANVTDSADGEGLLAALDAVPRGLPPIWQAAATEVAGASTGLGAGAEGKGKIVRLTLRAADARQAVPAGPWFFAEDASIAYDQPQARRETPHAHEFIVDLAVSDYAEPAVPTRLRGVLTFAEGAAYALDLPITAAGAMADNATKEGAALGAAALGGVLAAAFFGGLILNLMPCVFPVLGLKVLGFVQQAGADRKKITAHGLVFTSGVLLSFWLLAAVLALLRAGGEQLGWGFQLQEPGFVFVLAAGLLAFAMNLSGVFEFGLGATALGGGLQQKQGLAGSFFTGVLATVVATPCSAPFLAPALGAALALPVVASFAVFTAIGLGLSAPYLLLAAFPAAVRALPRPGAWMETFKQGMAFLLYGTVGLMVWILAGQVEGDGLLAVLLALTGLAFALWLYGRATAPAARPRRGLLVFALGLVAVAMVYGWPRAAAAGDLKWEPWSAERVAGLRAEGRPIYVDFTARWCFTCQTNKKAIFAGPGSEELRKVMRERRVALLRGDWTNRDPLITAELKRWDRAAVPFNLVYLPGTAEPKVLPELLTAATVRAALGD